MKIYSIYFFQIFIFTISAASDDTDMKNFGPFELPTVKYEMCKGPKKSDVTSVSSSLTHDEKGDWIFSFNLTCYENVKLDRVKIAIFSIKNNKRDLLYAYKIKEPCKHFLFAGLVKIYFNTNNCDAKGLYRVRVNMNEVLRSFLGKSFFYGDYVFKTHITSKIGNILCTETFLRFSKKGETAVASSNAA